MTGRTFAEVVPGLRETEVGWVLADLDRCWVVVLTDRATDGGDAGDWYLTRIGTWSDNWSDDMLVWADWRGACAASDHLGTPGTRNRSRIRVRRLGDLVREYRKAGLVG